MQRFVAPHAFLGFFSRGCMKTKLILAFFLAAMCAVWAQQDRGTLAGTVTDTTGAVMPNVKITAVQTETGAVSNSLSNAAGQYRIPNLSIGTYKVTFEAPGFKSVSRDNIQ